MPSTTSHLALSSGWVFQPVKSLPLKSFTQSPSSFLSAAAATTAVSTSTTLALSRRFIAVLLVSETMRLSLQENGVGKQEKVGAGAKGKQTRLDGVPHRAILPAPEACMNEPAPTPIRRPRAWLQVAVCSLL